MSGQFQADIDALKAFSKQIQELATQIGKDPAVMACFQGLAPLPYNPVNGPSNFPSGKLAFGNDSSLGFIPGQEFWKYYNGQYDGFASNFAAFVDALTALGEAAATIAGNYEDATSYDQVGQQDVQNAIANAPAPAQTPATTQPQTS